MWGEGGDGGGYGECGERVIVEVVDVSARDWEDSGGAGGGSESVYV